MHLAHSSATSGRIPCVQSLYRPLGLSNHQSRNTGPRPDATRAIARDLADIAALMKCRPIRQWTGNHREGSTL